MIFVRAFIFVLVCFSGNSVFAAASTAGWQEGISSTGQKQWFGPSQLTKSQAGMGQAIWNSVPGGVEVSRQVRLPFAGGVVDVVPKASVSPAGASGAIGRAIPKLLKQVSGPLGVGMVLYDLAKELNYDLSKDADGNLFVRKLDSSVCTVAPCYGYTPNYQSLEGNVYPDSESMCYAMANAQFPGQTITGMSYSGTTTINCSFTASDYGYYGGLTGNRISVEPSAPSYLPSSHQDFLDAIAAKSGWPSSSNLAKALQQSLDIDALNYVPMVPLSTTGPVSVSAPTVKEVTNDGTNTTEKTINTKTDLEYGNSPHPTGGQSVPRVQGTTNTVTNITITNNTTGAVTNSSSTVNNPAEEPEDLGVITDTPFASLPVLYTRKYPDGLTGVWNQKILEIKAAPLFSLVGNLMPTNIGSTGSCPAFTVPVNFGQWGDYGSLDFSPPCFIWDFGKAVILVSALLLCRRLIFGG